MNYNKSFVQIQIQRLKDLIEYKAKLEDIKVIKIEKAYTSSCSAVQLEELNKSCRLNSGLFKNKKTTINIDINGGLNILRKHLLGKCILNL